MSNRLCRPPRRRWPTHVLPLLVGLVLTACDSTPPDPTVRLTGATMGTSYELKLVQAPVADSLASLGDGGRGGNLVAAWFRSRNSRRIL